jgi:hypothetical protein
VASSSCSTVGTYTASKSSGRDARNELRDCAWQADQTLQMRDVALMNQALRIIEIMIIPGGVERQRQQNRGMGQEGANGGGQRELACESAEDREDGPRSSSSSSSTQIEDGARVWGEHERQREQRWRHVR